MRRHREISTSRGIKMEELFLLTVFLNRFLRPLPLGTILCGPDAFELQYLVIRVLLLGFDEPLLSSSSALEDTLASAFRSSSKQVLHKLPASVECHRGVSRVPHLTHAGLLPSGIGSISVESVSSSENPGECRPGRPPHFVCLHARSRFTCVQAPTGRRMRLAREKQLSDPPGFPTGPITRRVSW